MIGSVWQSGSWADTAWVDGSWGDAGSAHHLPDHVIVATVSYTDVKRRVRFDGPTRAASYAPVRRTVTFEG